MARRVYIEAPSAQIHFNEINANIRHWLAGAIAADARLFAPEDTGYLRTHIVVNADASRVTALGAGIPPNKDAPAYVEYGTRAHDIPNAFGWGFTARHPGTHAQPFLRPAAYRRRAIPPWIVQARSSLADR